jgi:hypothetical protein
VKPPPRIVLDLEHHLDQLLLGQLERGHRRAELLTLQRVAQADSYASRAAPIAPHMIP